MPALLLRRAKVSRKSGSWADTDFDVFDGDRDVGRIYRIDENEGVEVWFWGLAVEFQLTARKRYGRTATLEEAMTAFRTEYERPAGS